MKQNLEDSTLRHRSYQIFQQPIRHPMFIEAENEMDVENNTIEIFSDELVRFTFFFFSNVIWLNSVSEDEMGWLSLI